ncbi:hypothetical protein D3C80_1212330 [compost metagenome]
MDHEEVNVIAVQSLEAAVHGMAHGIGLQLVPPDFAGDVDLFTGCGAIHQCLTDSVLIVVGRSGIDVAITQCQGLFHGQGAFFTEHWPGAEAELGHVQALGINDVLHGRSPFHKR